MKVGRHLIRPFIVVCYGRLLETNPGLARPGRDMPSIQQYIKPKSYPSHISTAKYSFQKMYRQRQYVMIIPIIKRLFVWGLLTKLFTFHMSQFVRREKRIRQTDRQTGKRERGRIDASRLDQYNNVIFGHTNASFIQWQCFCTLFCILYLFCLIMSIWTQWSMAVFF